jgi:6-phosphogluconate dehydrogenase
MTHLGLIGLGTMGENLVRNIISRDESIVVWNRSLDKVDTLITEVWNSVLKAETLRDLVEKTESPRSIFLLVPAGKVTNDVAEELLSLLNPGDSIWDLGNAHWDTTLANQKLAQEHGIHWVGCWISGGSEGARLWPALMPGGEEESIRRMLPLLEKIAAKDFTGKPCVTYVGKAAAGNFVKMVHNGIEYAIMQGIAEIYDILRYGNTPQSEIQNIFKELNTGVLKSFLMDITVDILGVKDPILPPWEMEAGGISEYLLEKISDKAGSKGTGGWTVEAALKLGVPVPSIAESLFARWMSGRSHTFSFPEMGTQNETINNPVSTQFLHDTLSLVYLGSYLQGLDLIVAAEKEFQWWIDLREVLRIWQGGCIIRSRMLEILPAFYSLPTTADASEFAGSIKTKLDNTSSVLNKLKIPTPVIGSIRDYFMTLFVEKLPTNLIQAMRDSFGAHGVKRIGSDVSESFVWK